MILRQKGETFYSHDEMVKLCDEAKKDQRHACAEAVLAEAAYMIGDDVNIEDTMSVSAAHNACMNAKI